MKVDLALEFNTADFISLESLTIKPKKEKQNNGNWLLRDNEDFDESKIRRKKENPNSFTEIPMIDITQDD